MACIDMFNTEHQSFCSPMSPRISFSNDFIVESADHKIKNERSSQPSDSSDFEFSVSNYNMIAADELFFKGRLLPLKENCTNQFQKMTLRDELRLDDDGEDDFSARPPKSPIRWKELLGLKKSNNISKKHEKTEVGLEEGRVIKASRQEVRIDGVSRVADVEILQQ